MDRVVSGQARGQATDARYALSSGARAPAVNSLFGFQSIHPLAPPSMVARISSPTCSGPYGGSPMVKSCSHGLIFSTMPGVFSAAELILICSVSYGGSFGSCDMPNGPGVKCDG